LGDISTGAASGVASEQSQAHGIFAQSVGGGGGSGILTGGLLFGSTKADGTQKGLAVTLGGTAGGGAGGDIFLGNGVLSDGTKAETSVTTVSDVSHGLFAQSVGGGGGVAGDLGGISTEEASDQWLAAIALGGTGEGAGDGGNVTIDDRRSTITTQGDGAFGILAQSVGGGGGEGGDAPSTSTSDAANAQLAINLGSGTGSSGDGGTVDVTTRGVSSSARRSLTTSGRASMAVFAQSIGGGGGKAANGATALSGTVTLGGAAGVSGDGGEVSIDVRNRTISTSAIKSPGIVGQSIGGGGGYAGNVVFGPVSKFGSGLDMGSGASDGSGSTVTLSLLNTNVSTKGKDSPGLFVQSVGGGGGVAGSVDGSASGALIGSAGGSGTAGSVEVTLDNSNVTTSGARSPAIFAQSVGGAGSTTASETMVSVQIDDDSMVQPASGSIGLYAQSSGDGRGPIEVVSYGGILGADSATEEAGPAVFLKDGTHNTILNLGGLNAILTVGEGSTDVTNSLIIVGDIQLASGGGVASSFTNNNIFVGDVVIEPVSGTLAPTAGRAAANALRTSVVNTESGIMDTTQVVADDFVNRGQVRLGGDGSIGTTHVIGNFTQTESGSLAIEIDPSRIGTGAQAIDRHFVSGEADISGLVDVSLVTTEQTVEGEQVLPIIVSDDDPEAEDLVEVAAVGEEVKSISVTPSVVAQYQLLKSAGQEISLAFDIDFANAQIMESVGVNQRALSSYLEALGSAGALDEQIALPLIEIGDIESYQDTIDTLSSEVFVDTQIASLYATGRFVEELMSCAVDSGNTQFFDDGQCVYARVRASRFERDETSSNLGFDQDSWSLSVGGQKRIDNGWTLGGGFAYQSSDLNVDQAASESDGDQVYGGLSLKRATGQLELGGALMAGYGSFDTTRNPFIGESVKSSQDSWALSGRLRAVYLYERGDTYIKPRIDFGIDHIGVGDFSEKGDSPVRLDVDSTSETYFTITPAIEAGGDYALSNGVIVRPRATLGITQFLGDPSASATARFAENGSTRASFTTETDIDSTRVNIAAGVDVFAQAGWVVRAEAFASLSDNTDAYGASLKVEIPF
ncbi:MAG: autotransporter outer membrane beta-barrel domain-containing protein, partial [Thiohalocapsa sp.]